MTDVEDLIAKSVEKETETPEASVTPEQDDNEQDVTDKFDRLNLFFEKNQQVNVLYIFKMQCLENRNYSQQ